MPFRSEWGRYRLTPRHTAYVRVAEGCDHQCTFCAIPGFRGKFRSKPWASLLDEVRPGLRLGSGLGLGWLSHRALYCAEFTGLGLGFRAKVRVNVLSNPP